MKGGIKTLEEVLIELYFEGQGRFYQEDRRGKYVVVSLYYEFIQLGRC